MKNLILLFLLIPIHLFSQDHLILGGTYQFGNDINKEDIGEILVMPTSDTRAFIYMTTTKKAPSYNTSVFLTEIEVRDNKAYYQPEKGAGRLVFEFFKNGIKATDLNGLISTHVFLENKEFIKVDASIPTTFVRGNHKVAEIGKAAAEYYSNYYPNNDIWDFIGVWQYSAFFETLSISKELSTNSIVVHYNSKNDGFEDRFFENCQFRKGKIYGNYYGGKENVIIEIEEGNLLLTIDPFHQFQPIQKQLFKKSPTSVYKYCSKEENAYIKDGNKNVDSLPPGDRVLVKYEPGSNSYSPLFYTDKFNNPPSDQKKKGYIVSDQLSDIKPLFVSQNNKLKLFQNLNESEQFVKQLYTPEKLKENISIVLLNAEQNVAGRKKLFIDEEIFAKLKLENIEQNNAEVFITGTVDLSKNYRTIIIEFQYENEYYTYLINYDSKGDYIDHILIARDDYVESFTPVHSVFAPDEIYVNFQICVGDGIMEGTCQAYESKRYVLNEKGQFIASNYAGSNTE